MSGKAKEAKGKGKEKTRKSMPKNSQLEIVEFNNIALMYRPDTSEAFELSQRLANWLNEKNIAVHMSPHHRFGEKEEAFSQKILDSLDLVVVLGGDGTYLNAVRTLNGRQVPILGVNMGSLGFLTNTKVGELFEAVIYTLEGKMELRRRSMLSVEITPKNGKRSQFMALNDAVIERGGFSQLLTVEFLYEQRLVNEIKADGVVIATPTGSTAYNLSAGGPIIYPEVECLVVTPIAPHALTNRPMVFSDHNSLSFRLPSSAKGGILTLDGQKVETLHAEDEVVISRHQQNHYVVRHPTHNYFNLLREKLKFGERN